AHGEPVARLAVHEEDVAPSPHERVRRRLRAVRRDAMLVEQDVVEGEHLVAIGGSEVAGLSGGDEDVAVEAEVLLHVLANVRVIPVDAGVGEAHVIREASSWWHLLLREARHAVEAIVQPHSVPMNGGGLIEPILEADDDRRAARRADERPWILSVEAVHDERTASDVARDLPRDQ